MNKNENQSGNPQHLYNILYLQRDAFETLNPWIGTIVGSSNPPESEKNTAYIIIICVKNTALQVI